jgi:hypothetical protein
MFCTFIAVWRSMLLPWPNSVLVAKCPTWVRESHLPLRAPTRLGRCCLQLVALLGAITAAFLMLYGMYLKVQDASGGTT